jgi:gentisate 1,2-dioxygenase
MTLFEELMTMRDSQRKARASHDVVVRGSGLEWEENAQGRLKWYLHPALDNAPSAFTAYTQEVPPQHSSGKTLSQGGTLYYLLQGSLTSRVDDEVYHWEAGDLLTLPVLRDGVEAQHFNITERSAVLLALETNTTEALGVDKGSGFEMIEPAGVIADTSVITLGAEGPRAGHASLTDGPVIDDEIDMQYHRDIERWKWIRDRNERGRLLVRGSDQSWEQNIQGRVKYYLNPEFQDNALRDWTFFLHDIKSHTGMHRHQGGILIYVVEGEGYTVADGTRHDWSTGDMIMLPLQPGGVEHEHHNTNPSGTCRWVASFYWPWWELVASEFTQLRPHPDYVPGKHVPDLGQRRGDRG